MLRCKNKYGTVCALTGPTLFIRALGFISLLPLAYRGTQSMCLNVWLDQENGEGYQSFQLRDNLTVPATKEAPGVISYFHY